MLTFLAGSFRQSRDVIQRILLSLSQVYEQALYLDDLFTFLALVPRHPPPPRGAPAPRRFATASSSRAWGSPIPAERWAVRGLDFTLSAGERVALVGRNGAGKTTLVKLLARLYDPSDGRILLDGVDLREYDLESLGGRSASSSRTSSTTTSSRENIAVGESPRGATTPDRGRGERSLATRRRTPSGRVRPDARPPVRGRCRPSGGEWQKVALARAYMRDAQLLILDEPTAALDARAEYEVFLRFTELTAGRMAVLISHRFSTVRMADRILVLRGGEVVEQGTRRGTGDAGWVLAASGSCLNAARVVAARGRKRPMGPPRRRGHAGTGQVISYATNESGNGHHYAASTIHHAA